jgi:hypothetical protein
MQQIPNWTYAPNGNNWAVALPNSNPYVPAMGNVDGSHWITIPMYNGGGALYQDVDPSVVFEAGKTYTFTTSLLARSDAPAPGADQILARLFYRPVLGDTSQSGIAAEMWLSMSQLSVDTFGDFSVSVTPQPGDSFVGKTMGVVFYDQNSNAFDKSYFGVDNVRLTVVPEPSCLVLFGSAAVGFVISAWRKWKRHY